MGRALAIIALIFLLSFHLCLAQQDLKTVTFEVDPPDAEVWIEAVVEGAEGNFLGKASEPIVLSKEKHFGEDGLATFYFRADEFKEGTLPSIAWSRFSDGNSFDTGVMLGLEETAGFGMRFQNLRRQSPWVDGLFLAIALLMTGIVAFFSYRLKFSEKARLAYEKKKLADDRGLHETFAKYYIKNSIGSGGIGKVYRAVPVDDPRPEKDIALKRLNPSIAGDYRFLEQFNREINATKKLIHPNVIKVYDYGNEEGELFFTMELLEGATVEMLMRNSKKGMDPKLVGHIILQAAGGLHHAHGMKLVHRDVKGDNLFVREKNQSVVVIDFGCARRPKETIQLTRQSRDGKVPGTVYYMPPESAKIQTVEDEEKYFTQSYDQFSLAAVAFEMLTQRRPFYCASEQTAQTSMYSSMLFDSILSVTKFRGDLSTEFDPIFEKALAREPEDRYDSILEFAEEFERVCQRQQAQQESAIEA